MANPNQIAEIGTLVGEPARAAMLTALMDGRALTAGELAGAAGIAPQTASAHLAKLAAAGMLSVTKQGRHRYHRLANAGIANLLEGIMLVATSGTAPSTKRVHTGPRDTALRHARTCYDHFAGRLGVAIAQSLQAQGLIMLDDDAGVVTDKGFHHLQNVGLDMEAITKPGSRRPFCRPCLDWSERKPHLGGRLGALICSHFLSHRYVRRLDASRAVAVTPKGRNALRTMFDIRAFDEPFGRDNTAPSRRVRECVR